MLDTVVPQDTHVTSKIISKPQHANTRMPIQSPQRNVPQIGHGRVGLQPLPGVPAKVTRQAQPNKSQVGPLVDAPQWHLDSAALGQMTGDAAGGGSAALAGGFGPASLPLAGGIGRVIVVLVVLRLDGGVG